MASGFISSGAAVQSAVKSLPVEANFSAVKGAQAPKPARTKPASNQAQAQVAGLSAGDIANQKSSAMASEELRKISQQMQQKIAGFAPQLRFSVDQDSGRTVIKVTDRGTDEVVRQIPSEEALLIARDLAQFQKGLLLNRQV